MKKDSIIRKKLRIRKKINGSKKIPRVSFFKSLKSVYAQAIDDNQGVTICSAMVKGSNNKKACEALSETFAKELQAKNITKLQFDRNGLKYHGVVKEFADGLRSKGLSF